MKNRAHSPAGDRPEARRVSTRLLEASWFAPALIVLASVVVYLNSLPAPFVFDDISAIVDNPTIRDLGNWRQVLSPPPSGAGVTARPVVNLTLAIDHALHGFDPRGYRATNMAIHALAALALWGLARRTLRREALPASVRAVSDSASLAIALLWAVHPLQTETVVCVTQRTESLVSLFYIGMLYAFNRAVDARHPLRWLVVAVAASLAGMASKEVMVTAPVMVLFYDRTFFAGTFAGAWRQRWRWHVSLACAWGMLAWVVLSSGGNRGMSAGFGLGVSTWAYLLTQAKAIALYLKLSIWPHPLVADYGSGLVTGAMEVWPQLLLVLGLLLATFVALARHPRASFLGVWFFGLLAPSSSVVPLVTQTIAEHRMYLPLAAVVTALVLPAFSKARGLGMSVCGVIILVFGGLTMARNFDYRDEERLWRGNVRDFPESARAHSNLGRALANKERWPEAMDEYREALRLDPGLAYAHYNLGLALETEQRWDEAGASYRNALELLPHFSQAGVQLAKILQRQSRAAEALPVLYQALRYQPRLADAHFQIGRACLDLGRIEDAIPHLERALEIDPGFAAAEGNLGVALCRLGRYDAAVPRLRRAITLDASLPDLHFNLGIALDQLGRAADALASFREAVALRPEHAEARLNYGVALAHSGRLRDAQIELRAAARLAPGSAGAHANLANVLAESGLLEEAIENYEEALRLRPDYAQAHYNLGNALLRSGRFSQARSHFEEALRLDPNFEPAREMVRRMTSPP